MDNSLIEKYKLHLINGKRYYEFDMTESLPTLEDTVPYYFKYKDIEIYGSAWNRITIDILEAIDNINHKTNEELLNVHYYWTKTDIFSTEKRTNYLPFRDLYLNTNHTATHAMMNIQGLLKVYGIPLEECYFLIRRHISAEPIEVKTYFRSLTIPAFSKSLQLKGYSNDRIGVIVSNFDQINKMLSKISSGYNDFFLFDNYYYFTNYKVKLMDWLEKRRYSTQDKTYRVVNKCLTLLDDFYKNRNFYDSIFSMTLPENIVDVIGNEIEALFATLKSDVIVASKLYARMRMLHLAELDKLKKLNNANDLYRLARIYYSNKYYFKEPFISKDKDSNLSNDEIIISYAYSLDEITVSKLNQYAEKMHLKKLDNYLQFFDDIKDDYVQVEEAKLIRKDILDIDTVKLSNIKNDLLFYLDSFGNIDSESYNGYGSLPLIGITWNKYLLVGLCRSYFTNEILIKYDGKQYKKFTYKLSLNH